MTTDISTYQFNHTMIRVKDPQVSIKFYEEVLGMKLISKSDFPTAKFTLYFLAYVRESLSESETERKVYTFGREGVLELTHNWGTESDPEFSYNVNPERRGFGHLAICVDNIEAACKRFEELGVKFVKRLQDGMMKNIAFIADPDGYQVEIIPKGIDVTTVSSC
ncbi:16467_t:CDS:2 [Acaulospora morrowiae]|uniref:lactoylglutathione lyase n=1 Tax=Acaulospora morrowiae TaxID=94023 RepID=A0A9N9E9M8_9GLOM|nr:16467_t:CDS:2 [Acaulospora morrowiae]